jgi:hypothetical protein
LMRLLENRSKIFLTAMVIRSFSKWYLHRYKNLYIWFFSQLVGEKDSRIQGVKDSSERQEHYKNHL